MSRLLCRLGFHQWVLYMADLEEDVTGSYVFCARPSCWSVWKRNDE